MNPEISLIAALAESNRVIGKDGKLPWPRLPDDMKRFRDLTLHHAVIMGRKTWDSLDARFKPLPGRFNIVVSRDIRFPYPDQRKIGQIGGFALAHSIQHALNLADDVGGEIFIMGGGEIYQQTIHLANRLLLTLVEGDFEGDTFFPDYLDFAKETFREDRQFEQYKYKWLNLER